MSVMDGKHRDITITNAALNCVAAKSRRRQFKVINLTWLHCAAKRYGGPVWGKIRGETHFRISMLLATLMSWC